MTAPALAAAAVFAGLAVAVLVLHAAIAGRQLRSRPAWWLRLVRAVGSPAAALAAGAGVVAGVVTRWPVAVLAVAGLVLNWRRLFGGTGSQRAVIARLDALAAWTESLRDTIAGAIGLEQAIPAAVSSAAAAIQLPLARLRARIEAKLPLAAALSGLADDLADPSADLVVAALILNAGLRGPGLQATLGALAAAAREDLDMRRRVVAGRRGVQQGARIVAGVTVGFVVLLAVFDRDYLAPYGTPVGQLVLALVVLTFAAGFGWLHRLSSVDTPPRLLASTGDLSHSDGRSAP